MSSGIKRVGVLGSGVMGQGIAAHLANAGIPSYLFDIAPHELTKDDEAAGVVPTDRIFRNRISAGGVAAMKAAKPALLYRPELASFVTPCNYEDDLEKLKKELEGFGLHHGAPAGVCGVFPEAVEATLNRGWPQTTVQTCTVHLIRAAMRFVSYSDRKRVAAALANQVVS